VLCGVAAALLLLQGASQAGLGTAALGAAAAAFGFLALSRGAKLLPTAYVATLAGIGVALVVGRFHWSS
jgi:PTS system mannose-specific IID component